MTNRLDRLCAVVKSRDPQALDALLADEAVFLSPVGASCVTAGAQRRIQGSAKTGGQHGRSFGPQTDQDALQRDVWHTGPCSEVQR